MLVSAKTLRRSAGLLALLAFAASLPLPAFYDCAERHDISGYWCWFMGPVGPLVGVFAWYANPILAVLVIVSLLGVRLNPLFPITAFLLSASVLNGFHYQFDGGATIACRAEAGYWLWLLSSFVLVAASLYEWGRPLWTSALASAATRSGR